MGELLGLGLTHYPPLAYPDEHMADILRITLADEGLPPELRDPEGWPDELRLEYGDDGGTRAAADHRQALLRGIAEVRHALDRFAPDVVLIWGDDQYELFRESCIPAFCVLAYEDMTALPWDGHHSESSTNVWGESPDTQVLVRGARATGKALTASLLDAGFDMAYSYELPPDRPYPHAFLNTVLFLDFERRGFPYPILPVSVNCYGEHVVTRQGGMGPLANIGKPVEVDPPGPSPARCMDIGAAIARFVLSSDLRVALMASSSWSHAFLTDKTWRLSPDVEADRRLYHALRTGDYARWRQVTSKDIATSGQQELLNWFCLVGAMEAVGRTPSYCELVETYVFNSDKCFAVI